MPPPPPLLPPRAAAGAGPRRRRGAAFRARPRRSLTALPRPASPARRDNPPPQFAYTGEGLREHAGEVAEALFEAATQPKLWDHEVAEALHELEALLALHAADPALVVSEGVHAAAFGSTSPLGRSLLATPAQLHGIDAEAVRSFLGGRFLGSNMVLSATNVEHAALAAYAENALGGVPQGASAASPRAAVVGGESLTRTEGGAAHVALALPAPAQGSAQFRALGVLQALLGSVGPRGGAPGHARPGYLRQSRLGAGAKGEAHSFIRSATAFAYSYSDAGLLGIQGSCADHEAGQFVAAAVGFLKDAAGKPIQAAELERAKRASKLAFLADVEGRAGARDEAGTAPLLGRASGTAAVLKAIDAVTAEQVAAVARTALQGAPALAATGSLATIPRYDVLANMLR